MANDLTTLRGAERGNSHYSPQPVSRDNRPDEAKQLERARRNLLYKAVAAALNQAIGLIRARTFNILPYNSETRYTVAISWDEYVEANSTIRLHKLPFGIDTGRVDSSGDAITIELLNVKEHPDIFIPLADVVEYRGKYYAYVDVGDEPTDATAGTRQVQEYTATAVGLPDGAGAARFAEIDYRLPVVTFAGKLYYPRKTVDQSAEAIPPTDEEHWLEFEDVGQSGVSEVTHYVATHVNEYGEESRPSYPTDSTRIDVGSSAQLSFLPVGQYASEVIDRYIGELEFRYLSGTVWLVRNGGSVEIMKVKENRAFNVIRSDNASDLLEAFSFFTGAYPTTDAALTSPTFSHRLHASFDLGRAAETGEAGEATYTGNDFRADEAGSNRYVFLADATYVIADNSTAWDAAKGLWKREDGNGNFYRMEYVSGTGTKIIKHITELLNYPGDVVYQRDLAADDLDIAGESNTGNFPVLHVGSGSGWRFPNGMPSGRFFTIREISSTGVEERKLYQAERDISVAALIPATVLDSYAREHVPFIDTSSQNEDFRVRPGQAILHNRLLLWFRRPSAQLIYTRTLRTVRFLERSTRTQTINQRSRYIYYDASSKTFKAVFQVDRLVINNNYEFGDETHERGFRALSGIELSSAGDVPAESLGRTELGRGASGIPVLPQSTGNTSGFVLPDNSIISHGRTLYERPIANNPTDRAFPVDQIGYFAGKVISTSSELGHTSAASDLSAITYVGIPGTGNTGRSDISLPPDHGLFRAGTNDAFLAVSVLPRSNQIYTYPTSLMLGSTATFSFHIDDYRLRSGAWANNANFIFAVRFPRSATVTSENSSTTYSSRLDTGARHRQTFFLTSPTEGVDTYPVGGGIAQLRLENGAFMRGYDGRSFAAFFAYYVSVDHIYFYHYINVVTGTGDQAREAALSDNTTRINGDLWPTMKIEVPLRNIYSISQGISFYPYFSSVDEDGRPPSTVAPSLADTTCLTLGEGVDRIRLYRHSSITGGHHLIFEGDTDTHFYKDHLPASVIPTLPRLNTQTQLGVPDGITAHLFSSTGRYVVAASNRIYFSDIGKPHAFLTEHTLPCQQIMGLVETSYGVIVITDTYPFLVRAQSNEDGTVSVGYQRYDMHQPCVSGHSVVDMGENALYISHSGIVAVGQRQNGLLTAGIFSEKQWQSLISKADGTIGRIRAARYQNYYICSTVSGSFIFDQSTGFFSFLKFDGLYKNGSEETAKEFIAASYNQTDGQLYLLIDGHHQAGTNITGAGRYELTRFNYGPPSKSTWNSPLITNIDFQKIAAYFDPRPEYDLGLFRGLVSNKVFSGSSTPANAEAMIDFQPITTGSNVVDGGTITIENYIDGTPIPNLTEGDYAIRNALQPEDISNTMGLLMRIDFQITVDDAEYSDETDESISPILLFSDGTNTRRLDIKVEHNSADTEKPNITLWYYASADDSEEVTDASGESVLLQEGLNTLFLFLRDTADGSGGEIVPVLNGKELNNIGTIEGVDDSDLFTLSDMTDTKTDETTGGSIVMRPSGSTGDAIIIDIRKIEVATTSNNYTHADLSKLYIKRRIGVLGGEIIPIEAYVGIQVFGHDGDKIGEEAIIRSNAGQASVPFQKIDTATKMEEMRSFYIQATFRGELRKLLLKGSEDMELVISDRLQMSVSLDPELVQSQHIENMLPGRGYSVGRAEPIGVTETSGSNNIVVLGSQEIISETDDGEAPIVSLFPITNQDKTQWYVIHALNVLFNTTVYDEWARVYTLLISGTVNTIETLPEALSRINYDDKTSGVGFGGDNIEVNVLDDTRLPTKVGSFVPSVGSVEQALSDLEAEVGDE